jgi:RNA polymerase sigma-B factor
VSEWEAARVQSAAAVEARMTRVAPVLAPITRRAPRTPLHRHQQDSGCHDLVLGHAGLARSLAARFTHRGEDLDDLVQVAMVGLLKASQRFEPDRGVAFSTYATATILGELKRHFRDNRWSLHVSRSAQESYLVVRDEQDRLATVLGRQPSIQEIAASTGLSPEQVVESRSLVNALHLQSIDAPAEKDGAAAQWVSELDPSFDKIDLGLTLRQALGRFPHRQREVMRLRFVDECSQSEIAARLGVSQMQISRMLSRCLAHLRATMATEAPFR